MRIFIAVVLALLGQWWRAPNVPWGALRSRQSPAEKGTLTLKYFPAHLENLQKTPEQGRRLRFLNDAIAYACHPSMQEGFACGMVAFFHLTMQHY